MEELHYTYGDFSGLQIQEIKKKMRKQIFFLLRIVDPKCSGEYKGIDVDSDRKSVV